MKEPVLVIMAAGMGSRYGGLKQIDPVDEHGNLIIDFSIYDALKAGFKKVVFIIKHEIEADFREVIADRISAYVDTEYVYQEVDALPAGFSVPEGRVKPWGTAHAVLCCKGVVDAPFAVINADDYYGSHAFQMIYDYLCQARDDEKYRYAMVGYILENTLTENGHVARGVCTTEDGFLTDIHERTRIEKRPGGPAYTEDGETWVDIPQGSIVSMNLWGFSESILGELEQRFAGFLEENLPANPVKCEYFLPSVVDSLLKEGKATVRVLPSQDKWYGVTYRPDHEIVVEAVKQFKRDGLYPEILWGNEK